MTDSEDSFEIGDWVLTKQGERGRIRKPWDRDDGSNYDWWVDIHFIFKGEEKTSSIMYRNDELTKIPKKKTQEG